MYKYLNKINSPEDLKKLNKQELVILADEIRNFLIKLSEKKLIHFSSNLGIVEITIASLLTFNLPDDKVFYDTGHQSYVHKMLTGRLADLEHIKEKNHVAGFQDMHESKYDVFAAGHAGNSLSAALGMSLNNHGYVVPIIGDASLVSGVAFEGLNNIIANNAKVIVTLNDNEMSIGKNISGLNDVFKDQKKTKQFFECWGFNYIHVANGNNLFACLEGFEQAKRLVEKKPVILHIKTKKGFGYDSSLNDLDGVWHVHGPKNNLQSFGSLAANYLITKTKKDKNIHVINPAMTTGTSFRHYEKTCPENYHDVGIAEAHAAALASGMNIAKINPVIVYYSTFAQRAYDHFLHDIARLKLHATILIDRAGLAGGDGSSHHGIYDVAFLKTIPYTTITSPRNQFQLEKLIDFALNEKQNLFAIRYERYTNTDLINNDQDFSFGSWERLIENDSKIVIISYGTIINEIYNKIKDQNIDLINAIFITNYLSEEIENVFDQYDTIILYERVINNNSLYEDFLHYKNIFNKKSKLISLRYNGFIDHGSINDLDKEQSMTVDDLIKTINTLTVNKKHSLL